MGPSWGQLSKDWGWGSPGRAGEAAESSQQGFGGGGGEREKEEQLNYEWSGRNQKSPKGWSVPHGCAAQGRTWDSLGVSWW